MANSINNNQQLHTKLNPIYAAIDAYQFNRAIKLASALPDSNVLGKALLAHSYTKAGQKHQAISTLHKILVGDDKTSSSIFFELHSALDQQNELVASLTSTTSVTPPKAEVSSGKKGKKGKKKPVQTPKTQQQRANEEIQPRVDLIDRLDTPPSIPDSLDFLPKTDDNSPKSTTNANIITDETTLATLVVSLKSLNLPLTAYQMYARAAAMTQTELMLTKTFTSGLLLLSAQLTWDTESQSRLEAHILGHMQTVSLQLARVAVSANDSHALMLATAWACQSAFWQLEWLPEDDKRSLILPRLAESMAQKLIQQENDKNQQSKEIRLLCIRILKYQSKWDDICKVLETIPNNKDLYANDKTVVDPSPPSEFGVIMTNQQIKLEMAEAMEKLDRFDDARCIYESLLQSSPDDWSCWRAHLRCSTSGKNENGVDLTRALANKAIAEREELQYQLRGPHLMIVDIAAEELRRDSSDEINGALGSAIQQYAKNFAHRANCTIMDLDRYLDILLQHENKSGERNSIVSLLEFAESLRNSSASGAASSGSWDKKEQLSRLRTYIFSVKLTHKLLSSNWDLANKYLPDWIEIVKEWKTTFSLNDGEEVRIE